MNLKKNKKKNEQKLRVCGNVNGMEGTAVGECASLVWKVAHVTAGGVLPAAWQGIVP